MAWSHKCVLEVAPSVYRATLLRGDNNNEELDLGCFQSRPVAEVAHDVALILQQWLFIDPAIRDKTFPAISPSHLMRPIAHYQAIWPLSMALLFSRYKTVDAFSLALKRTKNGIAEQLYEDIEEHKVHAIEQDEHEEENEPIQKKQKSRHGEVGIMPLVHYDSSKPFVIPKIEENNSHLLSTQQDSEEDLVLIKKREKLHAAKRAKVVTAAKQLSQERCARSPTPSTVPSTAQPSPSLHSAPTSAKSSPRKKKSLGPVGDRTRVWLTGSSEFPPGSGKYPTRLKSGPLSKGYLTLSVSMIRHVLENTEHGDILMMEDGGQRREWKAIYFVKERAHREKGNLQGSRYFHSIKGFIEGLGAVPGDVLYFMREDGAQRIKVGVWKENSVEAQRFLNALAKSQK